MSQHAGINKRIADRLLKDRLMRETDHRRVVELAMRKGTRIEEVLIEHGIIDEAKLLKYVATLHKTQFVSTERLSKAKIDREALRLVSYKLAKHYGVYPLVYDSKSDRLIVATPDPDDANMIKEVSMASGVSRVMAMVARPEAVAAAIARGYEGDRSLFTRLLVQGGEYDAMFGADPFARTEGVIRAESLDAEPVTGEYRPPHKSGDTGNWDRDPTPSPHAVRDDAVVPAMNRDPEPTPDFGSQPGIPRPKPRRRSGRPTRPDDTDRGHSGPHHTPPPKPHAYERRGYAIDDEPSDTTATGYSAPPPDEPASLLEQVPVRRSIVPPMRRVSHAALSFGSVTERQTKSHPPQAEVVLTSTPYLESLRVLVGLLENNRTDLRGHSNAVARLVLDVCERIAMPNEQKNAVTLAAYLHDLGKMGDAHLTALNVAREGWHRTLAEKLREIPGKLMESVGLPRDTLEALDEMYEQFGGGGVPGRRSGKDIPMGARILAAVDSYADLTLNPNNQQGELFNAEDAVAMLLEHSGTVFDRDIVEVLAKSTSGERIVSDLLADRHRVLIVDPDPEETMVLQLRLAEQGYDVHLARNLLEARAALEAREFSVVVSEVDLDDSGAGFVLRGAVKDRARSASWIFVSSRGNRETVSRAFELGADDFITKPVATEIVVAKLSQLVERQATKVAPRGVSGSLSEMGLTDLVQVLWHGRKTCALRITQADKKGEIHFDAGRIVNAKWDDVEGETAFYRILAVGEAGEFAVDPGFKPGAPVILDSPEALLLEGMRLIDEGVVP